MLVMREEQMAVFSEYMLASFKRRLTAHLRSRFPADTAQMPDETLDVAITAGMERAGKYGVRSENDIRRFMESVFTLGAHFDTNPATRWAGEILRRTDLDGSAKMDLIDECATGEEQA